MNDRDFIEIGQDGSGGGKALHLIACAIMQSANVIRWVVNVPLPTQKHFSYNFAVWAIYNVPVPTRENLKGILRKPFEMQHPHFIPPFRGNVRPAPPPPPS